MDAYAQTLSETGVGGLLSGIGLCDSCDRDVAISDASRIIPPAVARIPEREWKAALYKIAITLSSKRERARFALLGNDIVLLEALAAIGHLGEVQILASARVSTEQVSDIEKNVPRGVSVSTARPGVVPIIESDAIVTAIAFEAGGGYLLVQNDVAVTLGAVRGQQFTGDIVALLPLDDVAVHERLPDWRMVRADQFNQLCRPNGVQSIGPNL
jgi:hypothetical protein